MILIKKCRTHLSPYEHERKDLFIYKSSYYVKCICFKVSLYHSSVSHIYVGEEVCRWSKIHSFSQKFGFCTCSRVHDYWSISSWKLHHLPLKDEHHPTNLRSMYHIWLLAHALLAFSFLQLPQNDTIPQGVLCRRNLYRWVFRNCSFYWLHLGSCNYHSVRLQS